MYSCIEEIPAYSGYANIPSSIAFVEQEPIIFSGTVLDNIIFGKPYDDEFFKKTVKACSL